MSLVWLQLCHLFLFIGTIRTQENCMNTRGKDGSCVHIDLCPKLRDIAYKKILSTYDYNFLRANSCGTAKVCCENQERDISPKIVSPSRSFRRMGRRALPDLNTCGLSNTGEKISGGKETDLGEYRWMVAIERLTGNESKVDCAGSLINTLYVLTAAHCVAKRNPKDFLLRLGEFDLDQMDLDCDEDNNCNDPVKFFDVSQIITHPNYAMNRNDIALLKLVKPVEYTLFILPICLPSTELLQRRSFINEDVFVAGWGATEMKEQSRKKLHVKLKVISLDVCKKKLIIRSRLDEKHLCAMSATGKGDTCSGDSGGPLMIEDGGNWYLIGIVSFGPGGCIDRSRPAVYVNVTNFMDWILENLIE